MTCLATLRQNEFNSNVSSFTTHIKPFLQQIWFLTGLNVGDKTRNIAIQLVLLQCCKTRFTEALLKSMECELKTEPLENILHWTSRVHIAPLYTKYKQYISNNRGR